MSRASLPPAGEFFLNEKEDNPVVLVSGGKDGAPRLWDLNAKDSGANPVVLRGHTEAIRALEISPNNHWLVTGSNDKTARLWLLQVKDLIICQ
jgi:WD40 repeat protein